MSSKKYQLWLILKNSLSCFYFFLYIYGCLQKRHTISNMLFGLFSTMWLRTNHKVCLFIIGVTELVLWRDSVTKLIKFS